VRFIAVICRPRKVFSAVAQSVLQALGGIEPHRQKCSAVPTAGAWIAALDDIEWAKELNQNLMPAVRLDAPPCCRR